MLSIFFPRKCIFCGQLLSKDELDLCHDCRTGAPVFTGSKTKIPFVAQWSAIWYYNDSVRRSIHKYKFFNNRSYCDAFGRMLAMKALTASLASCDLITWVPTSFIRRLRRGYDQSELLANAVGRELGMKPRRTLRKIRNNPPQSKLKAPAQRRANVLGVYAPYHPERYAGKRILLLDDVVTTGSTASECARILMTSGAAEVYLVAIAAASEEKKQ